MDFAGQTFGAKGRTPQTPLIRGASDSILPCQGELSVPSGSVPPDKGGLRGVPVPLRQHYPHSNPART